MILKALHVGMMAILVTCVHSQTKNLDMMGLINILYLKVDSDLDGIITPEEMATIWDNMDLNKDSKVNITEFTLAWEQMTNYSQEITSTYFFLADLTPDGVLDAKDESAFFIRFDLNGDGKIEASEFVKKTTQVYHEVPFVVLFERVEASNNNDQHLDRQEFSQLFKSLKSAADGSVIKSDFEKQWTGNTFGPLQDADDVFISFDLDKNGAITTAEVDAKFTPLDVSGNGKIEILEVILLANTTAQ